MESTKVFAILSLIVFLLGMGIAINNMYKSYEINRDTNAWLDRAQVASNPNDMVEYLEECRDGMEKWELTHGYSVKFFRTPYHEMERVMNALNSNIERCKDIKTMNKLSPEYQTALDDVRGSIRELDLQADGSYWTQHFGIAILPYIFLLISIILILIALFLWI